jgi:hypothetical protein
VESSVSGLSLAILGYLVKRPQAQDTVEGIARWWLNQWRVEIVAGMVRKAVRELCERQLLVEVEDRYAAEPRYGLNQSAMEQIQALLTEADSVAWPLEPGGAGRAER